MITLDITHRTLPAFRHSFLVSENTWITTRTPLYYMDLAISNEMLYGKHFEGMFPDNKVDTGQLGSCRVSKKQRFHLDDISVGCVGSKDSNLFYLYAMSTYRKVDRTGMVLFSIFMNNLRPSALSLRSGKNAEKFLYFARILGYKQWRERVLPPGPNRPYSRLLVEKVFHRIYPSILEGIYEKKSDLLLKILWDEFCITAKSRLHLFLKVPTAEHLRFILEVANKVKFDFWGMKYCGKGLIECVIIHFVKEKKYDLITLLLDYGFTLGEMATEDAHDTCCTCHSPLTYSFLNYIKKEVIPNVTMVRFLVRCYEICDFQIELPGIIEVYQKLSRTLPMPSLPTSVVRMHLHEALGSHAAVEVITAIYEACDVHPSDSSGVNPQTLSHLSRCALRDQLAASWQLPTAISDDYPLPTLIKRFIRLDF